MKTQKGFTNIAITIALALVVALGVTYFGVTTQKGDKGDRGAQGIPGTPGANGVDGQDGSNGPQGLPGRNGTDGQLGSVVSPNFQGPCVYYNGVKECSYEYNVANSWIGTEGTTTFATFDPTRDIATSSLVRFGCNIRTLATTTFLEFAMGATPNASTSRIGTLGNIDAGTSQAISGSTTVTQNLVVSREGAGYRYFNLRAAGGTNGTLRPAGACNATFRELVPFTGSN